MKKIPVRITANTQKKTCIILRLCRQYIFKPLPIEPEIIDRLLSTIKEINLSEESSREGFSTTSQQDFSNSLTPQYLYSSSSSQDPRHKKRNTVTQDIFVGKARKKVSAIPCEFGDFIIYLVGEKNAVNFLLFITVKGEDDSPMKPLGFAATYISFEKLDEVPSAPSFTNIVEWFNQRRLMSKYKYVYQ